MKEIRYIKIIKIALGSSIAILLANYLGLAYSTSAGIITLLTIQDTKKETLVVALKRIVSFLSSTCIAFLTFHFFSYHAITFGIYLFLFIIICNIFKMEDGIAMSAVLTTHYLIEESMSLSWIHNEVFLMFIGVAIGVILNLYMPRNTRFIRSDQHIIEEKMKEILNQLAFWLLVEQHCEEDEFCKQEKMKLNNECFHSLDRDIKEAVSRAYENMNNTLLTDTRYYIGYMEVRKNQCNVLKDIYEKIHLLTIVPKQAYLIADIMKDIAISFHEYNNAKELIAELSLIKERYKQEEQPITREEFENRAILYHIVNDLELFLSIKKEFAESLSETQIQRYWRIDD